MPSAKAIHNDLVLEPVGKNNKVREPFCEIDFGKCKETVAVEVLRDFLLKKIESGLGLKKSFSTSMGGILKQSKKLKP